MFPEAQRAIEVSVDQAVSGGIQKLIATFPAYEFLQDRLWRSRRGFTKNKMMNGGLGLFGDTLTTEGRFGKNQYALTFMDANRITGVNLNGYLASVNEQQIEMWPHSRPHRSIAVEFTIAAEDYFDHPVRLWQLDFALFPK